MYNHIISLYIFVYFNSIAVWDYHKALPLSININLFIAISKFIIPVCLLHTSEIQDYLFLGSINSDYHITFSSLSRTIISKSASMSSQ